ncbi:hypothetical protein MSG28_014888 [Choristoneura fumiferana]|uniref:Uncharacterized protein n=1 Tax=Choristoneura fumiferana TaxID=7141 RepID=A0ACC0KXG6_CHOFU|nr:hypothetical protein MSG28_014888 [Choristoneura fumiferana]
MRFPLERLPSEAQFAGAGQRLEAVGAPGPASSSSPFNSGRTGASVPGSRAGVGGNGASNFTGCLTLHAETQQCKHCCFTAGLASKMVVAIRADLAQEHRKMTCCLIYILFHITKAIIAFLWKCMECPIATMAGRFIIFSVKAIASCCNGCTEMAILACPCLECAIRSTCSVISFVFEAIFEVVFSCFYRWRDCIVDICPFLSWVEDDYDNDNKSCDSQNCDNPSEKSVKRRVLFALPSKKRGTSKRE